MAQTLAGEQRTRMYGLKKILVWVEVAGDPPAVKAPSREAVRQAAILAVQRGAEVTLLTPLQKRPADHRPLAEMVETPAAPRPLIDGLHAQLIAELQNAGVRVRSRIPHGEPGGAVIQELRSDTYDLVMAGGPSEAATDCEWNGRTLAPLLHQCPSPVWIARRGAFDRDPFTIIAVDDLQEDSQAVLPAAVALAQATDSRLLILHPALAPAEDDTAAQTISTGINAGRDEARHRLESRLHSRLAHTDYRTIQAGTRIEVSFGAPERVIADAVRDFEAALLVLRIPAAASDAPPAVSSSFERLVTGVPCSVLVLESDDFPCPAPLESRL